MYYICSEKKKNHKPIQVSGSTRFTLSGTATLRDVGRRIVESSSSTNPACMKKMMVVERRIHTTSKGVWLSMIRVYTLVWHVQWMHSQNGSIRRMENIHFIIAEGCSIKRTYCGWKKRAWVPRTANVRPENFKHYLYLLSIHVQWSPGVYTDGGSELFIRMPSAKSNKYSKGSGRSWIGFSTMDALNPISMFVIDAHLKKIVWSKKPALPINPWVSLFFFLQ